MFCDDIQKQRDYFKTGQTLDVDFRVKQLKKLKKEIEAYEENLKE